MLPGERLGNRFQNRTNKRRKTLHIGIVHPCSLGTLGADSQD